MQENDDFIRSRKGDICLYCSEIAMIQQIKFINDELVELQVQVTKVTKRWLVSS